MDVHEAEERVRLLRKKTLVLMAQIDEWARMLERMRRQVEKQRESPTSRAMAHAPNSE
jgi:hypothetical protein